jgi:serine/threonine protein kinase
MSAPQLLVISGPDRDKRFALHAGSGFVLGRQADVAYTVADPRVSRQHCEVRLADGKVTVAHRGGSGGTLVNGVPIDERVLNHGDTIQVGDTVLKYLAHAAADAPSTLAGGLTPPADMPAESVAQLASLTGQTLARYLIGPPLGRGGTSMVFRATDTADGQAVALKVMLPAYSRNEDEVQRFVRAMKTMLPLRHPHLVAVLAAGRTGDYCWSAMELVEGETLTAVIARIGVANMLDWRYAFRLAAQVGKALEYAHGHSIIHRDISPANILVRTADKAALLGDLMLAKALEGAQARQLTRPGELLGDVNYMPPERTRGGGDKVDARGDLFALGATCYALLTGKPPFAGESVVQTISNIRTATPAPPSSFQMGIPSAFEGVILKLLAKAPEGRYQSAAEMLKELERVGRLNGEKV